MTNLSKLQEAYNLLGIIEDDKSVSPKVKEIKRYIHEFMVDNEPTPKGNTFNIWDFVANDELCPEMNGVFHDKESGMAVATDSHILVTDMASYDESKTDPEGRRIAIDKYGKPIEGVFPKWQNVLPPKETALERGYQRYHVDVKDVDAYIKKCNAYMKINGFTGRYAKRPVFNIPNTNILFMASYLRKFLIASGGDIFVLDNKPNRPAIYWSEERNVLLMPMLIFNPETIKHEDDIYLE